MDLMYKIILILTLIGGPLIGFAIYNGIKFLEVPPVPTLDNNTWWGSEPPKNDSSITEFKITISNEAIQDIKNRLKNIRSFAPPLKGIEQQYGIHVNALKPVLDYWAKEYDWSARGKYLNQYPQFKTNIQGLNIHYVHVKPKVDNTIVLPLLLLHGWPSSVVEYYKLIPTLTEFHSDKYTFVFEVIIPSLPGYGFSDAPTKPGLGPAEISVIFKNLMRRLGHEKFYVHGGDVGGFIITQMAILFPQHILGLHTNFGVPAGRMSVAKLLLASGYPPLFIQGHHINRMYPLRERFLGFLEESAYLHMHATKPDTIGIAVNESPAGLAAYILEKFSTLTNPRNKRKTDGGLLDSFTYDDLLDNLMIYWLTQSFTTSLRLFAESFNVKQLTFRLFDIPISMDVPCAVARFRHEVYYYPNWILEDTYTNLIHWSDFTEGGHFPGLELPDILAADIYTAINKMRLVE